MQILFDQFCSYADREALVWRDRSFSYEWLLERVEQWRGWLDQHDVDAGNVVLAEADFCPDAVALFLALVRRGCILVPLCAPTEAQRERCARIAEAEVVLQQEEGGQFSCTRTGLLAEHPHFRELRNCGHAGLVLFSSGTTGEPKAAVHDFVPLLERLEGEGKAFRAISFLLYDHIGGINTMLYILAHGGCLVTVEKRDPDSVLAAVERHGVELLPTSPTFLNLILVSEADRRHDLSSLKRITYGTEPMPESTLRRLHDRLPHVRLQQTYGLSEVGIMSTRSRSSDSLWMSIGGDGYETRVVDGMLEIKSRSAMLGYLNAPSPFTEDGWFKTGDAVEVDGEYMRVLGRRSELINVGGEKVYPAEVEAVLEDMEWILEARVYGERNALTGQIVCADVVFAESAPPEKEARTAIRRHCASHLRRYQVPVRIRGVEAPLHSNRFKKRR